MTVAKNLDAYDEGETPSWARPVYALVAWLAALFGYVARFNVDMRGKRRYLTLYTSPGNTVAVSSVARLGRAEEAPVTAAGKGVGTLVSG